MTPFFALFLTFHMLTLEMEHDLQRDEIKF